MSTELDIPDAAWDAAMDAARYAERRSDIVTKALDAAAPRIVAAELDRIAADWERRSDNVPLGRGSHESGAVSRVGDMREYAGLLRARAAELRGTK